MSRQQQPGITRREVADLLGLHPDSVSRALHEGLASAVLDWGGRGKMMLFDRGLVIRWDRARSCPTRRAGQHCSTCFWVLEDVMAAAEHLLETRHGYGACELCKADWKISQPCR